MPKRVLILGAGRSSSSLIRHLLQHAAQEGYGVRIGDLDVNLANRKAEGHPAQAARSAVSKGWALVMASGTLAVSPAS